MKTRKSVLIWCALCLLSLGAASGVTIRTIAMYSGACDALEGFPGMLQSAGFVPKGTCKFEREEEPDKRRECSDEPCRVNGKKGHCVKEVVDRKAYCICKPNPTSR